MRRSLRTELVLSYLLLVGLMLLVMLVAVVGFFRLGRSIDRILEDNYKSVVAAQNMKEALERMDSAATFHLAGQTAKARQQYQENHVRFERAYQIETKNITEAGEQEISDDLGRRFFRYRTDLERFQSARPPLSATAARERYLGTLQPQFAAVKQRTQDILDLNQAAILRADRRAKADARAAALLSVGIAAAAVLFGLGLAWRNIGALMNPLVSLTRQAEQIGAGHLNQRIEVRRNDEIGLLASTFNQMAERLQEWRKVEAEHLQRAERMSDAALENLYDPVIVTDAAGRVAYLNRAAAGLFGPDAGARGRPASEVVREPRLATAIGRAVGQEETSAEEGEAALISFDKVSVDSEPRVYRLRASPMRGENGIHLGAVAVLEDVTYQQELDRLKTEFIGVASHELRTPVTSLLLGVQLLQEGAVGTLTDTQREVVGALRQDLQRLERMMRDLLDLTRLEAGATPPRFEVVAPAELIGEAVEAVAAQSRAKGIVIKNEGYQNAPEVRADRGQIGRVLVNLLSNALRHTPSGGSVKVTTEIMDGEGAVRFAVRDTGAGIPPEYLSHIFERFVQVPGATRGGAGLGLSIAQTIVRAHGGKLYADSEVGSGSTFAFTLPTAGAPITAAVSKDQ
ncbi:MAG: HAMP domain-containing protein [Cytophagales bacterium]|nr:HAMP domain-containing protein [Armatimonadota bacterium]